MNRKRIVLLLAVVCMMFALVACSGSDTASNNTAGDETSSNEPETASQRTKLVIAEVTDWDTMDMYQSESYEMGQYNTAEGILSVDSETGAICSNIASEINVSEDGKTVRLIIPAGMKFADGDDLTAEDVKASIEWGMEISPLNWGYAGVIESIEVDGLDVVINTTSYSPGLMYFMTSSFISVIDSADIDSLTAEELFTETLAYGPFYVDEVVQSSHLTLKRNENYTTSQPDNPNKGAAMIEEIEVRVMPDGFSRVTAIKTGEVDIAYKLSPEDAMELENVEGISLNIAQTPGMNMLNMNRDNEFLADYNVRKAIALLIDRDSIESLSNGFTKPAYSFVVPSMLDYDQEIADYYKENYTNDKEQAATLLKEAGFEDTDGDGYLEKDGEIFELNLIASSADTLNTVVNVLQISLKEAGIKVNIETMDTGYMYEKMGGDDYDLAVTGFIWAEPTFVLGLVLNDSQAVEDQIFYEYLTEAAITADDAKRKELLVNAQKVLMDEINVAPLFQETTITAVRDEVQGLIISGDAIDHYSNIEIK